VRSEKHKFFGFKDVPTFFLFQIGTLADGKEIEQFFQNQRAHIEDKSCPLNSLIVPGEDMVKLKTKIQDYAARELRINTENKCSLDVDTSHLKVHSVRFLKNIFDPSFSSQASSEYMMKVLNQGRPFALQYNPCVLTHCNPDSDDAHESVVEGRIWDPGQQKCMLKIRNSWGKHCAKGLDPKVKCEHGIYFVDIDSITSHENGITWIEK
jgi:hypothetical protein